MSDKEKPSEKLEQILASPDCKASEIRDCDEILSQLFRRLLVRRRMTKKKFRQSMVGYVKRLVENDPTIASPSSERGNLIKAFTNPYITIRSFNRAMQFLELSDYKLVLQGHDKEGNPVQVETDIVRFAERPDPMSTGELDEVQSETDRSRTAGEHPFADDLIVGENEDR